MIPDRESLTVEFKSDVNRLPDAELAAAVIYQGLLRFGRALPDYSRSDAHSVVVMLPGGEADIGLLRIIVEQENRQGAPLPVDSLIALALLRRERRVDTATLAAAIQRDDAAARAVLERLVEAGLVEAHGVTKGRTFMLASAVYREIGEADSYVRQAGFDAIQQEQMVLKYVREHGEIGRKDAADLCRLSKDQASRLLRKLLSEDKLVMAGKGRGAHYRLP